MSMQYRIDAVLGEGAMGTVFRAANPTTGRPVAVKVMSPRKRDCDISRARFQREAELVGVFDHPNLVSILASGTTERGEHFIVMDLVEGDDLDALVDQTPMSTARVCNLITQICDGLQHAHDRGVIHRDLKHANVLVERQPDGSERVRIIDFGIALQPNRRARRLTPASHAMGSPCCLAPEAAVGQPVDHRIDLFALGVIAYQLACGKKPFVGTAHEVICSNIACETPPMCLRVPGVDVDLLLELFAHRLLEKNPDDRFASAREAGMVADLIVHDRHSAERILRGSLARGTKDMPPLRRGS